MDSDPKPPEASPITLEAIEQAIADLRARFDSSEIIPPEDMRQELNQIWENLEASRRRINRVKFRELYEKYVKLDEDFGEVYLETQKK